MRWTVEGAENLLRLRAVAENGDWDDYHHFRKQRRQQRLYQCALPTTPLFPLECQPQPVRSSASVVPAQANGTPYAKLPLVA